MITVRQAKGVGIHAIYAVERDGERVANIERFGPRHPWKITSHYGVVLGSAGDIDAARNKALSLHYPSSAELYERACQGIEAMRREKAERDHASDIVRLTRAMLDGSNSARGDLEALFAKIDNAAKDRTDTGPKFDGTAWHGHSWGYYPEPPESDRQTIST